jgi:hypothetical protein
MADLEDDQPEKAMAQEDDEPPVVFQWHVPEGAPDPNPPLLNGFHHAEENALVAAMNAAWAAFNAATAEDAPPEEEPDFPEEEDDLPD